MKTLYESRYFCCRTTLAKAQIEEIPCIFPEDQGIDAGEQFAADCVIRH
jgi:hypothetical protein